MNKQHYKMVYINNDPIREHQEKVVNHLVPDYHPAFGLSAGTTKTIDGVAYGYEAPAQQGPIVTGLDSPTASQLATIYSQSDNVTFSQFQKSSQTIAALMANHYGQGLAVNDKKALQKLYADTVTASLKTVDSLHNNNLQPAAAIKNMEKLLAELCFKEMEVFDNKPKAQAYRYKHWTGPIKDKLKTKNWLNSLSTSFLQGDYLKAGNKKIEKNESLFESGKISGLVGKAQFRAFKPNLTNQYVPSAGTPSFSTHLEIVSEQVIGWEAQIYTAEHPIVGGPLDVLQEDTGLVHVSIAAGLWKHVKQHAKSIIMDAGGNILSESNITRWGDKFDSWVVANGSASWIYEDDSFHLKYSRVFSSKDAALKWLDSCTPSSGGKYYPIRACAYSVGSYGAHWVCHQNCNAFSYRKWNLIPVSYLVSLLLFGSFGNFPTLNIAKRKDPLWQYEPIRGGVPGEGLYYQLTPPYGPNPIIPFVEGNGYGLDVHYNPKKNSWVSSHANYINKMVPVNGPDHDWSIQNGWL